MARVVGQKVSEALGQPVLIENRQGAGGNIGTAAVARSAPDGYTVLVQSSAFAVNATLFEKPGYDALKDFEPIINSGLIPNIIFVHPSVPANNLTELVALAKQKKMSYASPGIGTTPHLTGEHLFRAIAKVDVTHVPFKGAGPAASAVVSGQPPIGSLAVTAPIPFIQSGRLRALAISSGKRHPLLPNVPTFAELGYPEIEEYTWVGFFAPAGTPPAIVQKLNAGIDEVLRMPDVRERLEALTFEPIGGSSQQFSDYVRAEVVKWAEVVKVTGAKVD